MTRFHLPGSPRNSGVLAGLPLSVTVAGPCATGCGGSMAALSTDGGASGAAGKTGSAGQTGAAGGSAGSTGAGGVTGSAGVTGDGLGIGSSR